MTIPVVYGVCRANPGVAFIFVSRQSMVSMMVNKPSNLTVYGVDVSHDYKGVLGMHRLFKELVSRFDFDAMADLHSVLRTTLLSIFCRAVGMRVSRLDKGRSQRRELTRRHNKVLLPVTAMPQRYMRVFEKLGLNAPEKFTSLWGPGGAPEEAYSAVSVPKRPGEKWIGIAPFAKHPGKIYPIGMMREAVGMIVAENPGIRVFLFGGGDAERDILSDWAADLPGTVSLAGKHYGFPVELALLSHVDVMVSMDSANMHLASLVGVPVVSVWGATHPYCGFSGWGQSNDNAVQLPMSCRPCSVFGNKPCFRGDYLCLSGIPPRTIVDRVNLLLSK